MKKGRNRSKRPGGENDKKLKKGKQTEWYKGHQLKERKMENWKKRKKEGKMEIQVHEFINEARKEQRSKTKWEKEKKAKWVT